MLYKFTMQYPETKPLDTETYGKTVIMSGFDSIHEVETAYKTGVRDICVTYQMIGRLEEEELFNLFEKFNIVVLDANSMDFVKITGNAEAYQAMVNMFVTFFEANINLFTFAIEPKHIISVLGEDTYLDYREEFAARDLPIFPLLQHESLQFTKDNILDKVTHVVFESTDHFNLSTYRSFENACVEAGVQIVTKNMNHPYRINKSKMSIVITDGWKHGTKYGTTYLYSEQTDDLMVYDAKNKVATRNKHREDIEALGVDFQALTQDVPVAYEHLNTLSWLRYRDKLAVSAHNVTWLDPVDYAKLLEMTVARTHTDPSFRELAIHQEAVDKARELVVRENPEMAEQPNKLKFIDPRQFISAPCNNCAVKDFCPEFKAGSNCVYTSTAMVNTREDLRNALGSVFTMALQRLQQAAFQERMLGNELSPEVSKEIAEFFKNAKIYNEIQKEGSITVGVKDANGRIITAEGDMGSVGNDVVRQLTDAMMTNRPQRTINVDAQSE